MSRVGIYVDGPNMERGLYDSGEFSILENIGSLLMEYASRQGEVTEGRVFVDEDTMWRSDRTREDYERNGFDLVESKSFRHLDPRTHNYVFGKSLTDPSLHCAVVDRLHDEDCPDLFVIATGDKDVTIVLEYIRSHSRSADVLGEAHSLSSFLVSKCGELGFGCHVLQLIARSSMVLHPRAILAPPAVKSSAELQVTDVRGRPVDVHQYVTIRNDRSNQLNPNNIAYWRSRGYVQRPEDWERKAKEKQPEEL